MELLIALSILSASAAAPAFDPVAAGSDRVQCISIKDSSKRASCLDSLLGKTINAWSMDWQNLSAVLAHERQRREAAAEQLKTSEQAAERARIQPLLKAFSSIEGAVDRGVTFAQYQGLLQTAIAETEFAARGEYGERAKASASHFEKALKAYRDAARWWSEDVGFYARRDNSIAYGGGLPFEMLGLADLVADYKMPTGKADLLGFHRGVPRSVALSAMWDAAKASGALGASALKGSP